MLTTAITHTRENEIGEMERKGKGKGRKALEGRCEYLRIL